MRRHQAKLNARMDPKPGMHVLGTGRGICGPAREIARFADVKIIGLNNNAFRVGRRPKYAKEFGLPDVQGDFIKLAEQFGENSFDTVYSIEATCYTPTWKGIYGKIPKVLEAGGVVSPVRFLLPTSPTSLHFSISVCTNGAWLVMETHQSHSKAGSQTKREMEEGVKQGHTCEQSKKYMLPPLFADPISPN